jgi:hypothetical protein
MSGRPSKTMNETNVEETVNLPTIPKQKKKSGFFKLLLTVFILIIMVALFFLGIIIGAQFGDSFKLVDPNAFPIPEYLVDGLRKVGKLDFSFKLTEEKINSVLVANEEEFKPLKNVYLSLENGYSVLSGQVETADLKEIAGVSIPEILWLFLPSVLNLKSEIAVSTDNGKLDLDVLSLSILNSENGDELVLVSGFDHLLQDLIDDVMTEVLPETVSVKEVNVTKEGIKVKMTVSLIKEE